MVSDQTTTKYAKESMALYKDLYTKHLKTPPTINSYRDLWGFRNMVEDLGKARAKEVVEYYFDFPAKFNHNLVELFRNYDTYSNNIDEAVQDKKDREKARLESAQRVREWEEKNGAGTGTAS